MPGPSAHARTSTVTSTVEARGATLPAALPWSCSKDWTSGTARSASSLSTPSVGSPPDSLAQLPPNQHSACSSQQRAP